MTRTVSSALCILFLALLCGCSTIESMTGTDLTSTLTKSLGVTETQANGGVGAMLQLAQEKLSAGEFDQVAKAVPGSQKYLDSAKQLLGGAKIGDSAGLQSAFAKLGLSPEMVSMFKPIVSEYVGKVGGQQAKTLFESALK